MGTFTSVDPVLGVGGSTGWNGYLYANANPVNLTDPSGEFPWLALGIIALGALYINEWRGNTYTNQMQGMSFWEAASYDHNRPCPTCEVALSFLVPPLGKAFAARDFAYTIATGTPAGKLEAIQQLLLMTAVESRLRQPMMTPGRGGGWTLTPPTGAVTAEFSLPRLDLGRIGFAGGGSTLQPRLAWGVAAIPVNVGGAVSALNTWGSNWILASSDDESALMRWADDGGREKSDRRIPQHFGEVWDTNEGPPIALGLENPYRNTGYEGVEGFARRKGALEHYRWGTNFMGNPRSSSGFESQFRAAMDQTQLAHFALDGLDMDRALREGSRGFYGGNYTNAEFFQIVTTHRWYSKTIFTLGNEIVKPPFMGR